MALFFMSLTLIQTHNLDSFNGVQALAASSAANLELYVLRFFLSFFSFSYSNCLLFYSFWTLSQKVPSIHSGTIALKTKTEY